jgi:hypothetical protein
MLRQSAADFYRESHAWRHTTDVSPAIQRRAVVELDLPAGMLAVRFYWLRLDGLPLTATSMRNLVGGDGIPRAYAVSDDNRSVVLDPAPERSFLRNGVVAHIALMPGPSVEDIPDHLYLAHRDGILYGAIARLLAMPNVSWGDLQQAQVYAGMAAAVKQSARREADSMQSPVIRKVRYGGIP